MADNNNLTRAKLITDIFSILVNASIAIAVYFASHSISNALMKQGDFTKDLITSLSQSYKENHLSRDIALITLDNTIGNDNPEMVSDIAAIIIESDSFPIITKKKALDILQKHDSIRWIAYKKTYGSLSVSADTTTPRNIDTTSKAQGVEINKTITQEFVNIIYIQANKNLKEKSEAVRSTLINNGFKVPQIQILDNFHNNSIRYFYKEDRDVANKIRDQIQSVGFAVGQPAFISKYAGKVPQGQIEIWLADKNNSVIQATPSLENHEQMQEISQTGNSPNNIPVYDTIYNDDRYASIGNLNPIINDIKVNIMKYNQGSNSVTMKITSEGDSQTKDVKIGSSETFLLNNDIYKIEIRLREYSFRANLSTKKSAQYYIIVQKRIN